jgi:hypothetical protein
MKIYCYKELKQMSIDELLDLLSTCSNLKTNICRIMKKEPKNKELYTKEYLYPYELNIRKILNELELKTELKV